MIRLDVQAVGHGRGAVDVNCVGLRRTSVMHVGDVVHIDDSAIDGLDREIVERFHCGRRVVQVDRVFVGADLLRPDRGDQVLERQSVDDIVRRNSVRMQGLLVEMGHTNLQGTRSLGRNVQPQTLHQRAAGFAFTTALQPKQAKCE